MSTQELIQVISTGVALVIAVGGWLINWFQRLNDHKARIAITVVDDVFNRGFDGHKRLVVQARNIGQSSAVLQEFYIAAISNNGKKEMLTDGQEHLNFVMYPAQMLNSGIVLQRAKSYFVRISYTQINKSKEYTFQTTISTDVFKEIDPHSLMNPQ